MFLVALTSRSWTVPPAPHSPSQARSGGLFAAVNFAAVNLEDSSASLIYGSLAS